MDPRRGKSGTDLARLRAEVDRWGDAIEADLHEVYGVDLLDVFRGRLSWRKLRTLIDGLGPGSRYSQAIALDEDIAREHLAQTGDEDEGPWRPTLAEHTPVIEALTKIVDAVRSLEVTTAQASTSKQLSKPRPSPRPEIAITRLRAEKQREKYQADLDVVAQAQARWERVHAT